MKSEKVFDNFSLRKNPEAMNKRIMVLQFFFSEKKIVFVQKIFRFTQKMSLLFFLFVKSDAFTFVICTYGARALKL